MHSAPPPSCLALARDRGYNHTCNHLQAAAMHSSSAPNVIPSCPSCFPLAQDRCYNHTGQDPNGHPQAAAMYSASNIAPIVNTHPWSQSLMYLQSNPKEDEVVHNGGPPINRVISTCACHHSTGLPTTAIGMIAVLSASTSITNVLQHLLLSR